MQRKRLLQLAEFLRNQVPSKNFDLEMIGMVNTSGEIDEKPKPEPTCGYAGCAIGWTPSAFPRSRWKLIRWSGYSNYINAEYTDSKGNTLQNFGAAMKFFGLTAEQANYLFEPRYYPVDRRGRKSVANRIEKFVNTNGKCLTTTEYYV